MEMKVFSVEIDRTVALEKGRDDLNAFFEAFEPGTEREQIESVVGMLAFLPPCAQPQR